MKLLNFYFLVFSLFLLSCSINPNKFNTQIELLEYSSEKTCTITTTICTYPLSDYTVYFDSTGGSMGQLVVIEGLTPHQEYKIDITASSPADSLEFQVGIGNDFHNNERVYKGGKDYYLPKKKKQKGKFKYELSYLPVGSQTWVYISHSDSVYESQSEEYKIKHLSPIYYEWAAGRLPNFKVEKIKFTPIGIKNSCKVDYKRISKLPYFLTR